MHQVAVIIGELIGRFTNDAIMEISVRQNGGVFEAESRLWSCYIGMPLYVCGFLVLGAALEHRLGLAGVIFGWGIVEVAIMVNTVAVCTSFLAFFFSSKAITFIFRCILQ